MSSEPIRVCFEAVLAAAAVGLAASALAIESEKIVITVSADAPAQDD